MWPFFLVKIPTNVFRNSQKCCNIITMSTKVLVRMVVKSCFVMLGRYFASTWLLQKRTGHSAFCHPVHEVLAPLLSLATCTFPNPAVSSINVWPLPNPSRGELAKSSRDTPYTVSSRCSRSPCVCEEHCWKSRSRTMMQNVQCPWSLFLVEFLNSKSGKAISLRGLFHMSLCEWRTTSPPLLSMYPMFYNYTWGLASRMPDKGLLVFSASHCRVATTTGLEYGSSCWHHCQRSVQVTSHVVLLPFVLMVLPNSSWPTLSLSGLLVGHTQQGSLLWSHSLDIPYIWVGMPNLQESN